MSDTPRDCEHGRLARSCEICELKRELAEARKRIDRADGIILRLTMDHNTGKNYVRGFDEAQEYFRDVNNESAMLRAAKEGS